MTKAFADRVAKAGSDKRQLAELEDMVRQAPDDASFAKFLRHFGGVSLNPNEQTCLQSTSVTQDMLLNTYPRAEENPYTRQEFPPLLDREIAKYTATQDAALRALHSASGQRPSAPKR
jgi:hypothetical protein